MTTPTGRPLAGLLLFLLFAAVVVVLAPWIGMEWIAPGDVLGAGARPVEAKIFWRIRVPRVLVAFLAGYGFGFLPGLLLSMIAVTGACILTFSIARLLLRDFLLRHYSGLRFKTIADLQETSINTAQGRYRYGMDKLRSLLNGELR